MSYSYTTRNGQRVEVSVAAALDAMAAEFKRVWGVDLIVTSGTRTKSEQQYLWNGWINRLPGFNLAARPGESNHEENGPIGPIALDLRDSGSDAGVTVIGSKRSNWLAANCGRWGFTNAGHYFNPREGWHYEKRGAYNGATIASGKLAEDGELGPATISKLQSVLGVTQDGEWGYNTTLALQKKLIATGHKIAADGDLGPATIRAMQIFLLGAKHADGQIGPQTIRGLQHYLNAGGKFVIDRPAAPAPPASTKLTVDGDWGPATTSALQKNLGVTVDGELGAATYSAWQKALGVTVDGQMGPETRRAYQVAVGATPDGEVGPETVRKLQEFLNAGKKFTKVTVPPAPTPTPSPTATPRTPSYPDATRGWNVPLASARDKGASIDWFIIHHQGSTNDDEDYFKTKNSRGSCPTWQVKTSGLTVEFIPPHMKPSSTGAANSRSVAVETQNSSMAPNWGITDSSHEAIAKLLAWTVQQKTIGGVPVNVKLDRAHVFGHNEATAKTGLSVSPTACPGPSMDIDRIVRRAKEIVAAAAAPQPDADTIPVKRSWLQSLGDQIKQMLGK